MDRRRLDSWKDIADYLARDVRTVARWERTRGLPVHRVPGGRRSNVFAYPDELDAWLANGHAGAELPDPITQRALASAPARHWLIAAGTIAGILLLWAGWVLSEVSDPPRRLSVLGSELLAFDLSGATRWTYRTQAKALQTPAGAWSHIGDLDRDGREEVLVTVGVTAATGDQEGAELLRLTENGSLQWRSRLSDRVAFRDTEYGPPWSARGLSVYRAGGAPRIAWLVHHFTWWPGLLVTFAADGRRLGTFVNAGWIQEIHQSADDRYLLIGGISNSRQAYFVAVLDASNPTGHSPEPPGSATECRSCPAGRPLRYIVLPRTDVGRVQPFPASGPSLQSFPDGSVQVQTHESAGPNIGAAIYDLTPAFTIERAGLSDSYWEWHRRLEADGRLAHTAADCPERAGLDVQRWTPADGWQTIRVAVR